MQYTCVIIYLNRVHTRNASLYGCRLCAAAATAGGGGGGSDIMQMRGGQVQTVIPGLWSQPWPGVARRRSLGRT